jgi:hypothetical protein
VHVRLFLALFVSARCPHMRVAFWEVFDVSKFDVPFAQGTQFHLNFQFSDNQLLVGNLLVKP